MKAIAKVNNPNGTKFALLVERDEGVDAIGLSDQGKEWATWVDMLPSRDRRLITDVLWSIGDRFPIDGPRVPTRTERSEIEAMTTREQDKEETPLS
jgi:hypothetical protein